MLFRSVHDLKKEGKELNNQFAAFKKQNAKVEKAIAAAIKRARDMAIKKAKEDEKARLDALKNNPTVKSNTEKPTTTKPTKKPEPAKIPIELNAENSALNENFKKNRGILPWPVDKGITILHFGRNQLQSGTVIDVTGITIDRKSTRLNSSHERLSRMPSSA